MQVTVDGQGPCGPSRELVEACCGESWPQTIGSFNLLSGRMLQAARKFGYIDVAVDARKGKAPGTKRCSMRS